MSRPGLFLLVGLVAVLAVIPPAALLHVRIPAALERAAAEELARAPRVVADRRAEVAGALGEQAALLAGTPGLGEALERGDVSLGRLVAGLAAERMRDEPVVVAGDGSSWMGYVGDLDVVEATRAGETPVRLVGEGHEIRFLALAPVRRDGRWAGAAGASRVLGEAEVGVMAGMARADVVVVGQGGTALASTLPPDRAAEVARAALRAGPGAPVALEDGVRAVVVPLEEGVGSIVFVRSTRAPAAVMDALRGLVLLSLAAGVILASAAGIVVVLLTSRRGSVRRE